jgi:hypothetical protein
MAGGSRKAIGMLAPTLFFRERFSSLVTIEETESAKKK